MKNKKWLSAIGDADEKYVAESDPAAPARRKVSWQKNTVIAAGFLLILTLLNVYLFAPIRQKAPDVSRYADSEYYGIIQKMNAYYYKPSPYKNNFERLWMKLGNMFGGAKAEDGMNNASGSDLSGSYEEITDNQTAGVTEGDRIKRSDRYIYYLDGEMLCVYTIAGEDSEQIARFDFSTVRELTNFSRYLEKWEMYLSADCKTVTVMAPYYSSTEREAKVAVLSLDVTDPYAIYVKNKTFVDGSYISSRLLSDGELLLMTHYQANELNYSDASTFVPQIGTGGQEAPLLAEDIVYPDILTGTYYTVLSKFDAAAHEYTDSMAFLSYSAEVYVSAEHIFTMRTYSDKTGDGNRITAKSMTDISVIAYRGDDFSYLGSLSVNGSVKDRYSLDEYEGVLRVVTTTSERTYEERAGEELVDDVVSSLISFDFIPTSANLYLFRLSDRTKIGEVIAFAPPGESVQSVRFDKNAAYVCTSLVLSDPVFFFDLSDPSAITYKDTGTIDGYSSSLVLIGNGFLLGIGYGSSFSSLKCEIYKESETGVVSVDKYEIDNCTFSEYYKSYYIDRENALFGIGVIEHGNRGRSDGYLVLHFDGYELREVDFLKVFGAEHLKRGCYVDGYFYAFGENSFAVHKIFD